MRQIALDTETTGLDPKTGHRIIEIACIELINRRMTGNHYHQYINPQREVDEGARQVHGLSTEFLADKPLFEDIVEDFLAFIDGAELIIHNAPFDVGFINHELVLWKKQSKTVKEYCQVLDTLEMARKLHPGQKNSLDALCKRYEVDNSERKLHGALIDADLLAHVYLAMTGGQISLAFELESQNTLPAAGSTAEQTLTQATIIAPTLVLPVVYADAQEYALHEEFISKF